ncbi:LHFPL tetraspan subfamily member 2 protein-like isoform X2 [Haliotis rubra]|uniref:LHFPL tetraspan subfamily member 2 protein-like isoform X2 n=1 Tax=Haliotis rufescens TaxID=6454 RepID=UPI001EAFD1CF|nr:LHFPL tetraspan subfamily member 2 protein-like isoform X2 [Haliotis rufescens]XP_046557494.1 LHFPL tetraspan subfamily member 2 protein-like isoform X2 [Haliotis rubra]
MPSPILLIWVLLSVLVAGTCTFSFLQPFWLLHHDFSHAFGMISYCFGDTRYAKSREVCRFYGGTFSMGRVPVRAWQASCVLYGGGCGLISLSAFVSVCVTCLPRDYQKSMTRIVGYVQTVAVLIMIAGLLIFPLGFGSSYFRHYCGDTASAYDSGHCLIGWSYMLGIMGTALSMFCPFLSQFTDMKTSDIFS